MPIPLPKLFTYKITTAEASFLQRGMRVAVAFGKSKIYTALVFNIHTNPPVGYEAKEIHQILDNTPVVNEKQLQFWEWIAYYYMCSLGDVYRASLPSAFILESETQLTLVSSFTNEEVLNDDEFLIYEALQQQKQINIQEVINILNKKTVFPVVKSLLDKKVVVVKEQIYEQYKPKLVKYVKIASCWNSNKKLNELLQALSRAKKQREVVLHYFQLAATQKQLKLADLQAQTKASSTVIKQLVDKQILEIYYIQKDRINFTGTTSTLKPLSNPQQKALESIQKQFKIKQTVLFKGVTSSGKTEVYSYLIKKLLKANKQVLYLLPEIALTTQLIERLQQYFGNYLSVFHSKYSINERVEVYNNVLQNKQKARLIVGARSAIFLPFHNLGLIVVDEEHETSYKQFDPAPRYHARDAAVVLANYHKANVLLGSATPSIESFYNANQNKYGYTFLDKRFGNVLLPKVELIDIKEKYRKKRMTGHFSDRLLKMITEALKQKQQVILFQNRRGYAPVTTCQTCGTTPQCPNCDVSLTFHEYKQELKCHYCGYKQPMLTNCMACGSTDLNTKGFGTEQIQKEVKELFPKAKVARMDLDTTRGKYSYTKIIHQFQLQEIDVLVGTQMLSKGLDFSNVSLVGIMNADTMLNFPDFRSHERSYQLMVQVSGRAGRAKKQGNVAIQTFNPYHQIAQQVSVRNYDTMYKEQLEDRRQFHYPPFYRLIKITLRHKNFLNVEEASNWLSKSLTNTFAKNVLGPTTPHIGRVRNLYLKNTIIKIPPKQSLKATKLAINQIINTFKAIKEFRSVKITIDVDAY